MGDPVSWLMIRAGWKVLAADGGERRSTPSALQPGRAEKSMLITGLGSGSVSNGSPWRAQARRGL